MCCWRSIFSWLSIALGFIAAALWFASAIVPVPKFEQLSSVMAPHSDDGQQRSDDVPLNRWAKTTASRNKWAAGMTALAVLAQTVSNLLPPCG